MHTHLLIPPHTRHTLTDPNTHTPHTSQLHQLLVVRQVLLRPPLPLRKEGLPAALPAVRLRGRRREETAPAPTITAAAPAAAAARPLLLFLPTTTTTGAAAAAAPEGRRNFGAHGAGGGRFEGPVLAVGVRVYIRKRKRRKMVGGGEGVVRMDATAYFFFLASKQASEERVT